MSEPKKAAVYTRVSTEEQAEKGHSIEMQEQRAQEHAQAQGWEVVGVFSDRGWSGAREDRPALQKVLAMLDEIDCIVIWSMDRLTRDLGLFAKLVGLLNEHGVQIESLTGRIDVATPAGELHAGIEAVVGQFERKRIGERVKAVLADRARKGEHNGGPAPYGYAWQDKRLAVAEAEAAIIRRIFDDYLHGVSQKSIARALQAEGVQTRHGGPWRQSQIARMVSSPIAAGLVRFKGEVFEGNHEAIIDRAVWDRVQGIRTTPTRQAGGRNPGGAHLLTRGVLRCGQCGSALIPRKARPNGGKDRYECQGRVQHGREFCAQPSIRRELVDQPFLRNLLDHYIDFEATRQRIEDRAASDLKVASEVETEAEADVARIERALATTERDYDQGEITGRQYAAREARLTGELEAAHAAVQQARSRAQAIEASGVSIDTEETLLRDLAMLKQAVAGGVEAAPNLDALRNVIGQLFESIELIRHLPDRPGFGSGRVSGSGVIVPTGGPDPGVLDGDRSYWLLPRLRASAVDLVTFRPIGQAMPVPPSPQYPTSPANSFLWRYCWW
jgi:site-specific DNA recombinase